MTQWKATRETYSSTERRATKGKITHALCRRVPRGADEEERSCSAAEEDQGISLPDSDRGTACESSGRQRCAGVRVRGSANAKWGAPLRRSPRQTLNCTGYWSTIRTSGLILALLCPELQRINRNEWEE